MSDRQTTHERDIRILIANLVLPLALASGAVTFLVLVSPIGLGSGSGVIGYSVYRLAIFALIQFPLAALGITGSVIAWLAGRPRWGALILHLLVIVSTFFFYFSQANTICRLMSC